MFPWDCSNKHSELTMLPSFHFMLKSVRKHPSFNWDLPGILKEWLLRSQYQFNKKNLKQKYGRNYLETYFYLLKIFNRDRKTRLGHSVKKTIK